MTSVVEVKKSTQTARLTELAAGIDAASPRDEIIARLKAIRGETGHPKRFKKAVVKFNETWGIAAVEIGAMMNEAWPGEEFRSLEERIAACTTETSANEINAIIEAAVEQDDAIELEKALQALKKQTKVGLTVLREKANEITREVRQAAREEQIGSSITDRYKFVSQINSIYDTQTGLTLSVDAACNTIFHTMFGETAAEKYGLAKDELLGDPRSKYDRIAYRPGKVEMTVTEKMGLGSIRILNVWRPSDVVPLVPTEEDGAPETWPIFELMDNWFGASDAEIREFFNNVCAHIVQRPAVKQKHAFTFISGQGAGKGTFFKLLTKIVGAHNVATPTNKELKNMEFGFIDRAQLAIFNETMTGDNRDVANTLKEVITEERVNVRKLYRDGEPVENHVYCFFNSNHDVPQFLEEGDRRAAVHRITSPKLDDAFFARLHEWIDDRGAGLFLHWLMERDLSQYNPHAKPPMTDAKQELIHASKGEVTKHMDALYEAGASPFDQTVWQMEKLKEQIKASMDDDDKRKVTTNVITAFLRTKGGGQIRKDPFALKSGNQSIRTRWWCIRDLDKWSAATNDELQAEFSNRGGSDDDNANIIEMTRRSIAR